MTDKPLNFKSLGRSLSFTIVPNLVYLGQLLQLCNSVLLVHIMSRKHTDHDNIVRVVQCHKVGMSNRKISKQTVVNEKNS